MGDNAMGGMQMRPADFAAMLNGNGFGDGFGGCGFWVVILFIAMMFGWNGNGFGGWGNNGFQNAIGYENLATSNEVQRGFDNQNSMANEREILASINANSLQGMQNANQNAQYITGMVNDKYGELSRDVANLAMMGQQAIANQNDCCCSTKMMIADNAAGINAGLAQNRYDAALNTANLGAGISQNRYEAAMNTSAIIQAVKDEGAANRMLVQQEAAATRQQNMQDKMDAMQQRINDLNMQVNLAGVARVPMTATYNAGPYPFCGCNSGGCCGM
jgi:hypothetical protein